MGDTLGVLANTNTAPGRFGTKEAGLSGNRRSRPQETKVPRLRSAVGADARVRFTREVLGDALVALMHEWPFEEITVQDILDRAGVGRTTSTPIMQTSKTSS